METGISLTGFTILRLLGAGGMGQVYLAEDSRLRRKVALKALLGEGTTSDRSRLLREARVAAALNHPGICTVYQVLDEQGQVVIVMEFVEGRTLGQALLDGNVDNDTLLRYAVEITDALAYAHAQGVVHRDLKPGNVMIGPGGRLKILDFGLARQYAVSGVDELTREREGPVTKAGEIIGTLQYMAPELLGGQPATPESDVWAVGVTLYEMASGKRPFDAPSNFSLGAKILNEWPEPLPGHLPAELTAIVHRCLQKQAAHRYANAGEIRSALARATASRIGGVGIAPASAAPPELTAAVRVLDSIAVLPLRNVSGDAEQEYFSDGLTETLINDLAKIRALKVISRTSVMRYKGSDRALPEIARELNVKAIVEGSAMRAGDQVRVMVQLVDAASDATVWAETYTKPIGDLFGLQSEVAAAIAGEIRVAITPPERKQLGAAARVAPEVYEMYLKGRYFWNMRTAEGFQKAAEHFQKAMGLAPGYAPPYAVMADTLLLLGVYGFRRPRDVFPAGLHMVRKAIDLDPSLAEAHSTLGWGRQLFDLDRPGAEQSYNRALELNPGDVTTRLRYGAYLVGIRRTGEGLDMLKTGLELDPLSMIQRSLLAYGYYLARDYGRAIELARSSLDLDPNFWWAHWSLAEACRASGGMDEAIAHLERAGALSPHNAFVEGPLGAAYATVGRRPDAQAVLAAMTARSAHHYVAPYWVGLIHLGLGDRDRAFECFASAVEERDSWISFCAVTPALDEVRDDPRLDAIIRQMQVDW